jgi:RimJ/RimL family protein N-acetyltransferase
MNSFQEIKSDRLILKILGFEDKEAFLGYRVLPEVYQFQLWKPKNLDEVESFIKINLAKIPDTADTWLQMGVHLHTGQLIGDIGLHFLEDGAQMEIGYTFSPEYQRQGYALEAVKAILGYLFDQLEKHRVTASVDPENHRSINLLKKIGFRQEGHFKKSILIRGEWCDDVVYAILQEEWKALR